MGPRSRVATLTLTAWLLLAAVFGLVGCSSGDAATSSSASTTAGAPVILTGDRAELQAEIERIREGMESGTLVFDWYPPGITAGDLPSDPIIFLDMLEQSLADPDVTLYLLEDAGDAPDLRAELAAMPEVARLLFVSNEEALAQMKEEYKDTPEIFSALEKNPLPACLEIWLTDYMKAASFADQLRDRPEVDEIRASGMDYAQWTAQLRSLTHPPVPGEATSTTG